MDASPIHPSNYLEPMLNYNSKVFVKHPVMEQKALDSTGKTVLVTNSMTVPTCSKRLTKR